MSTTDHPPTEGIDQRGENETQPKTDLLAQKKTGTSHNHTNTEQKGKHNNAANASSSSSSAPPAPSSFRCDVCARHCHSAADLRSHLSSHAHADLQRAYDRGAKYMSAAAYDLICNAIEFYPAPSAPPAELSAAQADLAEQLQLHASNPHTHYADNMLALRQSFHSHSAQGEVKRFLAAMHAGLRQLLHLIAEEQREAEEEALSALDDYVSGDEHGEEEEC